MEEEKINALFGVEQEPTGNVEVVPQQIQSPELNLSESVNRDFNIKDAFNFGWEIFKKNKQILLILPLVYFAVLIACSIILDLLKENFTLSLIANIFYIALNILVSIGIIQIFFSLSRGGAVKIKDLFGGKKHFWRFAGGSILYGFIVGIGYLLLIIPGIIWQIKYGFFQYLIVDKGMNPMDAIKESGRITYGYKWKIFMVKILTVILFLVGVLFFGVGILVAYPVSLLAMVYAYRKLIGDKIESV